MKHTLPVQFQTIRDAILASKKRLFIIIMLLLLLPLIIGALYQQQNIRQRAAENERMELEFGINKTGSVLIEDDPTASGGKAIVFGQSAAPIPTTPPVSSLTRPVFGTYVDIGKFTTSAQAKDLIVRYAKVVYPGQMNWCGPGSWTDPQAIMNQPSGYYVIHPNHIASMDQVIRNTDVLTRGIIARGYVLNTREGDWPRPDTLPQDVSNPLFEQAMIKVEVDCTKSAISTYKDRITNWRIANEIFDSNGQRRPAWHTNKPVDIRHKLTAAREVDPNAQFFIDDYGAEENNPKSTGIFNYLRELRSQGYAIHGIGFQGHFSLKYPPNYASIRNNIQRFKDAGFDVAFTEVDVAIDGVTGTEDEKRQRQKDIFKNIAQICKDFSNCKYFMLFGMDDNASWLGEAAKAHPFDTNYQPKPAFTGLQEVLGL